METLEQTIIKIIDMKGRILHTQSMNRGNGINELNICGSDLSVGSYTCRIIRGNKERNIQFTKA
ncbi:MAG: hypothetical protein ACJAZ2_001870 [Glaciecola sp.]|jgi:hypothetical protein